MNYDNMLETYESGLEMLLEDDGSRDEADDLGDHLWVQSKFEEE